MGLRASRCGMRCGSCALFRRTVLEGFPFDPRNDAADRDFWLRIADAPLDLGAVYEPAELLGYRVHEGQYSGSPRADPQGQLIRTLERSSSVAKTEPAAFRRELGYTYAKLGKALLEERKRSQAWRALLKALRLSPFDPRIYRFVVQAALPAIVLRWFREARNGLRVSRLG